MEIFPAVLVQQPQELVDQLTRLHSFYSHYQIDIADNIYVPNKTLSINDIGDVVNKSLLTVVKNLTFDFHLMVKDYKTELEKIKKMNGILNTHTVFIHASLHPNYDQLLTEYHSFSFGLVLNPSDSVEELAKNYKLKTIPYIQIMTIEPGFQGRSLAKELLQKIDQLRDADFSGKIYLDGGVNDQTLPIILQRKNKPDGAGIGSYLSKANNIEERVKTLNELLTTYQ